MFNIGPQELLIVLVLALIVVGPQKLPELSRQIGRGLREFRKVQDDVKGMVKLDLDDTPADARTPRRPASPTSPRVHRSPRPAPTSPITPEGDVRATTSEAGGAETPRDTMKLLPRRGRTLEERAGTMTLTEHLTELRRRVIIVLWAIGIGAIVAWFVYEPFLDLVREPFCTFVTDNPQYAPPTGCDLVFSGPFDAFAVRMKTVLYLGFVLALPVVLFQLWAFVVPGLTAREKRWSVPFVVASFLLFLAGAVTAFFVLPKSLQFLLGFAGEGVVPLLTVDRYVGFVTLVTLAFGVSFLFPVVLVFLEAVGVITPDTLSHFRRYAIVVIATIAAVITPGQDVFSMIAMMVPMYLFYEAAIIIGRIIRRQRIASEG